VNASAPDTGTIWSWLAEVPDPELPVLSIVDLGIVRDVRWDKGRDGSPTLCIAITPTYTACPATAAIGRDIQHAMSAHGIARIRLEVSLAPPWTTDAIGAAAREKLRSYGIAPPERSRAVVCPRCASADVREVSRFGSTPCKALYRCRACLEPFDLFKCH